MSRDTWHVTCDIWHVTCDTWHMTCDTWHVTSDMWHVTYREWWTLSKKSRIRETKNFSTDADSSTNTKKILLVRQNSQKNYFFLCAQRFYTFYKQKFSNWRPLLSITFPQGFRISKNIGHPTSGSGGKKTVKRYLKSEHTDRQTDKQTHKQTYGHFDL